MFLFAGQDVADHHTWYGAAEARGVADAYAAVVTLTEGDEDEHIPLWNIVTKQKVTGRGEFHVLSMDLIWFVFFHGLALWFRL